MVLLRGWAFSSASPMQRLDPEPRPELGCCNMGAVGPGSGVRSLLVRDQQARVRYDFVSNPSTCVVVFVLPARLALQ